MLFLQKDITDFRIRIGVDIMQVLLLMMMMQLLLLPFDMQFLMLISVRGR